jgi:hypothetical protein
MAELHHYQKFPGAINLKKKKTYERIEARLTARDQPSMTSLVRNSPEDVAMRVFTY